MVKRRITRRTRSTAFTKRSRSKGNNADLTGLMVGAIAYGAGREYISNAILPLTNKIPLGGYADEAILGIMGYVFARGKLLNSKFTKNLGRAMLTIESARVGSGMTSGITNTSQSSEDGWV